jgi:threonine/homoserine/homoserine lactone efflux protein
MEAIVAIAIALTLIVMVPGPNAIAVSTAAARSRRSGLLTAAGVSTGDMVWATAAMVGLGAALAHARPVFRTLRWLGAAYLLWFAYSLWRQRPADTTETEATSNDRPFVTGLLVDLANPKAAIFFTTLFSSLLPVELSVGIAAAVLAEVAIIVYGWYCLLALVLSRPVFQRVYQRLTRALNRVAAGVLGAFSLRLATS